MKTITVILERASDGTFGAYGESVQGIYGMGATAQEAKKSAVISAEIFKKENKKENLPPELRGAYKLVFKFDTESLLNYYKGVFSAPALSKLTGINEKQIHHYATGLKKPRQAQKEKIQNALHKLGEELLTVEL
ncbi:MAG: hypothetical protein M9898_02310 [Chitinophagaceae bacterium]|nr:hypothetical protein [Chitinophagaceae bacterium]